jgi:thiol-disulfide isomerase/thioredoxin
MQKTQGILILITLLLYVSCGSNRREPYSGNLMVKNPHFLDGLTQLEDGETRSLSFDSNLQFYTWDGVLIPLEVVIKNSYSGNYIVQHTYVDKNNQLKLAVVAPMPEDIKKRRMEMEENLGKPNVLVGKKALPFAANDMDGHAFTHQQQGYVIVMNFWFMACGPCVQEMPELNQLVKKYQHKKVRFLGFASDKKEKLVPFLAKHPFSYHVIPASTEISDLYEVKVCPTHIIIDKNSTIKYYSTGSFNSTTIKDFEKEINQALTE